MNADAMARRFACNAVLPGSLSFQADIGTSTRTCTMDTNLLILLSTEQARCREVQRHYAAMGSIGCFAAAMLDELQRRADQAIIRGCEAEIRACLKLLQAVRQPPQASPSFAGFTSDRGAANVKPSLADAIASVGRRMPRLGLSPTA
jgi:hypothetical protein